MRLGIGAKFSVLGVSQSLSNVSDRHTQDEKREGQERGRGRGERGERGGVEREGGEGKEERGGGERMGRRGGGGREGVWGCQGLYTALSVSSNILLENQCFWSCLCWWVSSEFL